MQTKQAEPISQAQRITDFVNLGIQSQRAAIDAMSNNATGRKLYYGGIPLAALLMGGGGLAYTLSRQGMKNKVESDVEKKVEKDFGLDELGLNKTSSVPILGDILPDVQGLPSTEDVGLNTNRTLNYATIAGIPLALLTSYALKKNLDTRFKVPEEKAVEKQKYTEQFNKLLDVNAGLSKTSGVDDNINTARLRAAYGFLTALETEFSKPENMTKAASLIPTSFYGPMAAAGSIGLGALALKALADSDRDKVKTKAARKAFRRRALMKRPDMYLLPANSEQEAADLDKLDSYRKNVIPINIDKYKKTVVNAKADNKTAPVVEDSAFDKMGMEARFPSERRFLDELSKSASEHGTTVDEIFKLERVLRETFHTPEELSKQAVFNPASFVSAGASIPDKVKGLAQGAGSVVRGADKALRGTYNALAGGAVELGSYAMANPSDQYRQLYNQQAYGRLRQFTDQSTIARNALKNKLHGNDMFRSYMRLPADATPEQYYQSFQKLMSGEVGNDRVRNQVMSDMMGSLQGGHYKGMDTMMSDALTGKDFDPNQLGHQMTGKYLGNRFGGWANNAYNAVSNISPGQWAGMAGFAIPTIFGRGWTRGIGAAGMLGSLAYPHLRNQATSAYNNFQAPSPAAPTYNQPGTNLDPATNFDRAGDQAQDAAQQAAANASKQTIEN